MVLNPAVRRLGLEMEIVAERARVATLAEALSSILWAASAALTAAGTWFGALTGLLALLVLAVTWMLRPRGDGT